jgi:ATP-binding cassette subfamily B protein
LIGAGRSKAQQPPTVTASETELFGGARKNDGAYWRHFMAHLNVGFWTMARQIPHLVGRSLQLSWAVDRLALVVLLVAELGQGIATAFGLLATNQVLVELFAGGPTVDRVRAALPALAWVAAASALAAALRAASTAATGRLQPKVERAASSRLMARAIEVEMLSIEDSGFRRTLETARHGIDAARRMVGHSVWVLNALIGVASAGVVLAVLHPVLLPLLALIALPKGFGAVRTARRMYLSTQGWMDHSRKRHGLTALLTDHASAAEVRVHGAGPYLLGHYETEQERLARAEAGTNLSTSAIAGTATAATYLILALLLGSGAVPLAAAGTAVLAIRNGTGQLGTLVRQTNMLYEQALFFLDLERAVDEAAERAIPAGGQPLLDAPELVCFDEVTFTYPGREAPAVDHVSLTVGRGQIIALVGENGSGKTTLAKLLAGLYLPDTGRVLFDGTDITDLDRASVFEQVALVDQQFMHWPFTARINVTIGRTSSPIDEQALAEAAAFADAESVAAELPAGWDTLLDRGYHSGVQLSGGQWQRLALARAKYRSAPIVIADEPTAALDAAAEIAAFDKIRSLAADGRTVVLITHRLASVRHADVIYVLHQGRLVEQGSCTELLARPTRFGDMYAAQARQYGLDLPNPNDAANTTVVRQS